MSRYTVELRYICESMYDGENHGGDDVDAIISYVAPLIFNFDFPMIDESYKMFLAEKIIRHYYTQEIAYETVGLWHLKLKTKMQEIMPYYLQLYRSAQLDIDPFNDTDFSINGNDIHKIDGSRVLDGGGSNTNAFSRTPQGRLVDVIEGNYLTEATHNTRKVDDTTTEKYENEDIKSETVKGKRSAESYSKRLMEYRKTFLNIDMMVIEELSPLFIGIW